MLKRRREEKQKTREYTYLDQQTDFYFSGLDLYELDVTGMPAQLEYDGETPEVNLKIRLAQESKQQSVAGVMSHSISKPWLVVTCGTACSTMGMWHAATLSAAVVYAGMQRCMRIPAG